MKKILISITCLFAYVFSIQAQTLYGTTGNGGSDGGGTINKFQPATNNLIVARSFESLATSPGYSNLIQAKNGKLYGMTSHGGKSNVGVIFSFDPSSSTYTKLKDFSGADGATPYGSLIQARDGKLYGMTSGGGTTGFGVIFSFNPSSLKYEKLKDFDNTNGGQPIGSLMQATDGKLYGMTPVGGSNGWGVIFAFDPASKTYAKLKDFDRLNANPSGSLIQATDGKLYGMTNSGGSNDHGLIFSFDPSSSTYTELKDFSGADGAAPYGSLMQATDGRLYGMTVFGGSNISGVFFSFDPLSSTYTKLKDFDGINGENPYGSLIQATDRKLYGMTARGGNNGGNGVIFCL
jgi:uncharacterized repeat protein (TIGR03803 family)